MSAPDRPATRIWCFVCAAPKPFRNDPLPDQSRQHLDGFDGDYIRCLGCLTLVLTVYAEREDGDRPAVQP